MVFLKSILAGVVALVVGLLVAVGSFVVWGWWVTHRFSKEGGGIFAATFASGSPWMLLIVAVMVFLAGFYWEFRRVTTSNRRLH
jgi:hypothetical protein